MVGQHLENLRQQHLEMVGQRLEHLPGQHLLEVNICFSMMMLWKPPHSWLVCIPLHSAFGQRLLTDCSFLRG